MVEKEILLNQNLGNDFLNTLEDNDQIALQVPVSRGRKNKGGSYRHRNRRQKRSSMEGEKKVISSNNGKS